MSTLPATAIKVRSVRLAGWQNRWTVTLYDLGTCDNRGTTALGYRVRENGRIVAEDMTPAGAVYGSPMHADDSDATMAAACSLIAHAAQHDPDDNPIEPGWDAEGLSEAASLRWEDL